ncbi:MAG: anti-sigma factor antagonist [Lachnospiraceae bacterium]|nr:anti-sigma factor antagonist [Lachnospiraceae bacterium]
MSSLNIKANDSSEYTVVSLEGRIDSTNADQFEKDLFAIAAASQKDVSFDAEKLEYISSAGLRVLLKLQKTKSRPISVFNVSRDVYDIFETTGFTQLFDIKKQYREISVDGCEIIGKGYYGTVYRLDEDTVVKKYESPEAISIIENEKRLARLAFVAGIPTAISFDIVKIGNSYGSVFELLKAKTFHDLIKEKPNEIDSIISDYTELIKKVHSISMEPGTLPSCKEMFLNKLVNIRSIISEKLYEGMKNFYIELPEDNHVVHGDIQMKNVMLSGDEPMLIDMDTLSQGLPLFDFGGLYLAYIAFTEDDPNNSMEFFGIDTELCNSIFNKVFDKYYKDIDESERKEILTKIKVIGYTSFLNMLESRKEEELAALQIKHTIEYLESVFC